MEDVIYQSTIAFVSQVGFIWARTYNVHTTANLELKNTMVSGAMIHILWLVGISVGANGVYKVMVDYNMMYIPVILASLAGSLIGCYVGMIKRINSVKKKQDEQNIHGS